VRNGADRDTKGVVQDIGRTRFLSVAAWDAYVYSLRVDSSDSTPSSNGTPLTPLLPPVELTASVSTVLSQDVVTSSSVLVNSTSPTPIAPFLNLTPAGSTQPLVESLVVTLAAGTSDPTVAHVRRDPTCETGWASAVLFGGRVANEVAAGTAYPTSNIATVHGFFTDDDGLWWSGLGSDGVTWASPAQAGNMPVSQLRTTLSPAGRLVVYGVTAQGDLVTAVQDAPGVPFSSTVTGMDGGLTGGDFRLVMADESSWVLLANTLSGPVLAEGMLGQSDPAGVGPLPGSLGPAGPSCWAGSAPLRGPLCSCWWMGRAA